MDKNLEKMYREFEELSIKHEPLASAGIMMAQALKIYKALLSEEEFELMAQHVFDSIDHIAPLEKPTLQ